MEKNELLTESSIPSASRIEALGLALSTDWVTLWRIKGLGKEHRACTSRMYIQSNHQYGNLTAYVLTILPFRPVKLSRQSKLLDQGSQVRCTRYSVVPVGMG